jgi:hypothetical protein
LDVQADFPTRIDPGGGLESAEGRARRVGLEFGQAEGWTRSDLPA